MIDEIVQTSESESASSSSSASENELITENLEFKSDLKKSWDTTPKSSPRNILQRLTSAQIRQFVSPDFKHDSYNFYAPSLLLSPKRHSSVAAAAAASSSKKNVTSKELSTCDILKRLVHKNRCELTEKVKKSKKKLKKAALERLRLPTLSFILKTRRMVG